MKAHLRNPSPTTVASGGEGVTGAVVVRECVQVAG
jgi:hypothetical protein